MRHLTSATLALALVGCADQPFADALHPSGSKTLVVSQDRGDVHVVNVEEGTVSTVDLASREVRQVEVGGEPTRIARHGGRVFVTLREEGSLAVLAESDDGLTLEQTVPLGAEPFGVVTTEDGRVYVALSMEDAVVELDAQTLEVTGRWDIPDEPRWLAVSPGRTVFVGCQKRGGIYQIDTSIDEVVALVSPSTRSRSGEDMTTRVTGDPAVSPDGRFLLVPVLEVDNRTSEVESAAAGNNSYYATVTAGVGRFNPGAAVFGLNRAGRAVRSLSVLHAVTATTEDSVPSIQRSFVSSVTVSPTGEDFLFPLEGSRTIVSLARGQASSESSFSDIAFVDHREFRSAGFATPPRASVLTDPGPRSVVYVDEDTPVVHNWLARTVTPFAANFSYSPTGEETSITAAGVRVETSRFDPSVEAGRIAFHTAQDPAMQADGSGVSCATCHFDGREDGLSWPLTGGTRQTPTLVGRVSETAPITWSGDVESVADEVQITSVGRMGGSGASATLADSVAAYIDWTRQPQPSWALAAAAVERGRLLFEREDVACASCHPAPTYTDGQSHAILGSTTVNTPTLRGIASSAPYLHDGSRGTLRDVISMAVTGSMGDASGLSDSDLADLEAFLKSL